VRAGAREVRRVRGLVLGLLDTSREIGHAGAGVRARDLTISWSRFKYPGPILEEEDLDTLLRRAAAGDARYLLVQSWGHVLHEVWSPDGHGPFDLLDLLDAWVEGRGFLVAGRVLEPAVEAWRGDGGWWGLDRACLLVDLETYRALNAPSDAAPAAGDEEELPGAVARRRPDGTVARLDPSPDLAPAAAPRFGSGLVRASLAAGLPVYDLTGELDAGAAHLAPEVPVRAAALAAWQGEGLAGFDAEVAARTFGPREVRFLADLHRLTGNLRRGVFVWNIEPYDDVQEPPPGLSGPLRSLYSVAAGLKPNFLLERLGFDERTRVVLVDYSAVALEFRRLLLSEWDGSDYPSFLRRLFHVLPPERAFYLLWRGAGVDDLSWDHVGARWREEIDRWGGAAPLRAHWTRYRRLRHELVHCDLLADPAPALATVQDEESAAIWWSNAFFSVHSNWHHDAARRRELYTRWIGGLEQRAPRLWLYGSSSDNASVNGVQAGEYARWYRRYGGDELEPGRWNRVDMRY
jgi:hypothetical protein